MIHIELSKKLFAATGSLELQLALSIKPGEFVALYGPSGAGKTSVIRMIAGLLTPDKGRIDVDGECWFDAERKINRRPQQRQVGMVFQDYALFPNMTVYENIAYALEKGQPASNADDMLEIMELTNLRDKKPALLSGGQKQRVALGRALVRKPSILLLDEPMSALDSALRFKMQEYMATLHRQYNYTTILISHDMLEVTRLATVVYVLEQGRIVKQGTPSSVLPIQELKNMVNALKTE